MDARGQAGGQDGYRCEAVAGVGAEEEKGDAGNCDYGAHVANRYDAERSSRVK